MSFDFDAAVQAPFRMQPGLRRLAAGACHLTPCAPGARHMREKLAVLSAYPQQALLAVPGFDAGPALDALARRACAEHPATLRWDGRRAEAPALGVAVDGDAVLDLAAGSFGLGDEVGRCLRGLPPGWRLPGLLSLAFEEDFAVLDGRDGRIPWLAVALPSHWAPESKLGLSFAAVHAPVADSELLRAATAALVKLATGDERWERFVWTIADHPRLHAHPAHTDPERWRALLDPGRAADDHAADGHAADGRATDSAAADGRGAGGAGAGGAGASSGPPDLPDFGSRAWWRTERQTFLPLRTPQGDPQAVFTIHVQTQPLAEAVAAPGRAAQLRASLASMSEAVLAYRGLTPVREGLLAWLDARTAPA